MTEALVEATAPGPPARSDSPAPQPVIELESVTVRFGDTVAVREISLSVQRGELLMLLGGSGSGKTTLLETINRLVEPLEGRILLHGQDVSELVAHELRRRVGYSFQGVGLFSHMTVAENVGITPKLLGWSEERIEGRVRELLEMVDLPFAEYAARAPESLSGGQRQRVGVARALAADPEVVLFDEPFGALDPLTRATLQASFDALRRELGVTGVFVTHDVVEALCLGDRVAVLEGGRLVQIGTPEELRETPASDHVRELLETPLRALRSLG